MSSATAPKALSLLKSITTTSSSSSSTTRTRPSILPISGLRPTTLPRLSFSATDSLFSLQIASKTRFFSSGKASRAVVSMSKKSVGDLTADELKGKKVFVRADLNLPLDDRQNVTRPFLPSNI